MQLGLVYIPKKITWNIFFQFEIYLKFFFKEIHAQERLFRLIVQSLCPQIYGHEVVKAGLTLGLFGGCQRYLHCRADPHILVVGDPGLGKSRMLQACANVSPRGKFKKKILLG